MTFDDAVKAATAAETAYTGDLKNVATINASIATATAPLAPAQAQLATDAAAYNSALDTVIAAAQAAKVTVPTA